MEPKTVSRILKNEIKNIDNVKTLFEDYKKW